MISIPKCYYISSIPNGSQGRLEEIDAEKNNRNFYKPEHEDFFSQIKWWNCNGCWPKSWKIMEIRLKLVASVCAIENCSYDTQKELLDLDPVAAGQNIYQRHNGNDRMLFAPIPNFIFTRDIGIVINEYVLLNKPAKKARTREALLAKYIFFNHPLFEEYQDKILELTDGYHHFLLPKEVRRPQSDT